MDKATPGSVMAPCPFCGKSHTLVIGKASDVFAEPDECGDPLPYMHTESYAVTCNASKPDGPGGCGASGGYFPTEGEAVTAWNRRAAIAALQAEPQGWLPIETAPKDGTQIILSNGVSVAQGWWEHQEPYIRERRDMDGRYVDQDECDGFDGWLDCDGGMLPEPTRWMPLPTPSKD